MIRWKRSGKPQPVEKAIDVEIDRPAAPPLPEDMQVQKTTEKSEESPILDYQETMYAKDDTPSKRSYAQGKSTPSYKRSSWESPSIIERNVDAIHPKKTGRDRREDKKISDSQDLEAKVDKILWKRKR